MMDSSFEVLNPVPSVPLLANVPHSSDHIPEDCRGAFVLDDAQLQAEQGRIVDWFTDELYAPIVEAGGCALVNRVSRLVVDPERFEDDAHEIMAARGIGVIYEKTTLLTTLREKPQASERDSLLNRFYRPYHATLNRLAAEMLDRFGYCLLLDCHSFPERVLPYELRGPEGRPDICIGTDAHHSPEPIVRIIERCSERYGFSHARNTPFAGTVVPLPFYKDSRVHAVMLEINRGRYMDEARIAKGEGFSHVQAWVRSVVEEIVSTVERGTELRRATVSMS